MSGLTLALGAIFYIIAPNYTNLSYRGTKARFVNLQIFLQKIKAMNRETNLSVARKFLRQSWARSLPQIKNFKLV